MESFLGKLLEGGTLAIIVGALLLGMFQLGKWVATKLIEPLALRLIAHLEAVDTNLGEQTRTLKDVSTALGRIQTHGCGSSQREGSNA
jgi:hypothetical protein